MSEEKSLLDQTIDELKEASQKSQLLLARIECDTMNKMLKRLNEGKTEEDGKSKRVKTKTTENTPTLIFANDSFLVCGMDGTLGYNLRKYGLSLSNPVKREEKYFYFTCINGIIDISTTSRLSYLTRLSSNLSQEIESRLSFSDLIDFENLDLPLGDFFKSLNTLPDFLKKALTATETYQPRNDIEEDIKNIYRFIIEMNLNKGFYFHDDRIKLYSEQDYIAKFWSYPFGKFFGSDENLFIQWSDNVAQNNSSDDLKLMLNMRVMTMKHKESATDESNSEHETKITSSKFYKDKLELVLGGHSYVKQIIALSPRLSDQDILDIEVPYVQIMGFKAIVSVIHIQDKGLLVTEDVMSFCFPSSEKQIRSGEIIQMIKAFSLVKKLLDSLKLIIQAGRGGDNTDEEVIRLRKLYVKLWLHDIISEEESEEASEEASDDVEEDEDEDEDEENEVLEL